MNILATSDFYQIELSSLIADYDRETLTLLYQPLIGHAALSLFFAFWSLNKKQNISPLNSHEQLLISMQMSTKEFVEARKKLEATGLLRTYLLKGQGTNIYHYYLYAPKTPAKFFDDILLNGLLTAYVGEKEANRLKRLFIISDDNDKGEEISATFQEIFSLNLENEVFLKLADAKNDIKDRKSAKIDSEFNYDRFIEKISSSSQISKSIFNKKTLKEIERLATLYGASEDDIALRVIECYDPNGLIGEKINFKILTKMLREDIKYPFLSSRAGNRSNLNSGNSDLAKKINLMETVSPKDFLSLMQNGTRPVSSDLALIDDISKNLGLSNSVINAIVDYVLYKNGNVLSRAFVEKIAGSIAREGITTTIDAMNFLNKVVKTKQKLIKKPQSEDEVKNSDNDDKQEEFATTDWDSF
jgi:replication initiation and membrane attachment protein